MKLNLSIILALVACGTLADNVAQENTAIEITQLSLHDNLYNGIVTGLGSGNEKEQSKISFAVNIGLKTSIVGEKSKAGWGISCDPAVDNSCAITDDKEFTFFYFSKMLQAQKAELYLRLDQNSRLEIENPKVDKIAVDLVVGGNKWVLNDWGVLGLSPSGSFAKFLTQVYGEKAVVLLKYSASSSAVANENLVFDFKAILNPKYNDTDIVHEFQISENATNWSAVADWEFISAAWSYKNTKVCFNSETAEIVQVPDSTDRCDAVKNLICNGKIGPDCTRANANFTLAPNLILNFEGNTFEFAPEEYIYYDGDKVECRFGDIGDLRTNGSCEEDAELGVGKLFFQKYIPVFKFNYGGNTTITFLNHFTVPDVHPNTGRLLWIIIGGIAAVIALVVIISVILKKKQESDDDYYPSYSNTAQ